MADKCCVLNGLPQYTPVDQYAGAHRRRRLRRQLLRLGILLLIIYLIRSQWNVSRNAGLEVQSRLLSLRKLESDYAACARLRQLPQDPSGYRGSNARHVEGQNPILIRNATVWTGKLYGL